jgi:hypothetical protein
MTIYKLEVPIETSPGEYHQVREHYFRSERVPTPQMLISHLSKLGGQSGSVMSLMQLNSVEATRLVETGCPIDSADFWKRHKKRWLDAPLLLGNSRRASYYFTAIPNAQRIGLTRIEIYEMEQPSEEADHKQDADVRVAGVGPAGEHSPDLAVD